MELVTLHQLAGGPQRCRLPSAKDDIGDETALPPHATPLYSILLPPLRRWLVGAGWRPEPGGSQQLGPAQPLECLIELESRNFKVSWK